MPARSLPLSALLSAALLSAGSASAQSSAPSSSAWHGESSGTTAELRGLSVVSDKVAWASGAKGTVLRTIDGAHWQAMQVPDADNIDFRDIHAFDAKSALVMGAGPGAASRIYRTIDGGASWQLLTTNQYADGFWDAMAFWDKDNGILFGDPVKGRFQVYVTADGGATWREVQASGLEAMPSEGAFAASGTCLTVAGTSDAWISTGGAGSSRVFHSSDRGRSWRAASTPIAAGAAAKGVFSVAFPNPKEGVAVGGDYKEALGAGVNGALTSDGGATWTPVQVAPAGYMSVVVPVPGAPRAFVAAGLAGSGFTRDGGRSWTVLDRTPMNTVGFANPATGWAVGPKGLLMKYRGAALDGRTAGAALTPTVTADATALDAAVAEHLGRDFNGVVLVRADRASAPTVRAYGMANFDKAVPTGADTPFQIGSISKWITSVAVLRLVDQGKLALDVPIRRYLPAMPEHSATRVTLRHLMSNTSGIPNGVMQEFRKDNAVANLQLTHVEAALRFGAGATAFEPGTRFDYSPTNWTIVAAVIERVTGKPYAQAVDELVFRPAALTHTAVPDRPYQQIPGTGLAYEAAAKAGAPRAVKMAPHIVFVAASGTIYSTARDLAALAEAVYETGLLSPASRAELSRVLVADEDYALGGRVKRVEIGGRQRSVAWETGAVAGFKTLLAYVPGEARTVVILNNTDMPQPDQAKAGEALLRTLYR